MLTKKAADIFDASEVLYRDEVEVSSMAGELCAHALRQQRHSPERGGGELRVSVRAALGGRTARATTNKLTTKACERVVAGLEDLARVQQPDPDLLPMPDAAGTRSGTTLPSTAQSRHFEETAAITPRIARRRWKQDCWRCRPKHKLTTAGIFLQLGIVEGIFNSRGLARWHQQTSAEISITMLATDSSGWQKANSPNVPISILCKLGGNCRRKSARLCRAARDSGREVHRDPRTRGGARPGRLHVLGLRRAGVLDQRSFLNNRMGTQLFGENINIWRRR